MICLDADSKTNIQIEILRRFQTNVGGFGARAGTKRLYKKVCVEFLMDCLYLHGENNSDVGSECDPPPAAPAVTLALSPPRPPAVRREPSSECSYIYSPARSLASSTSLALCIPLDSFHRQVKIRALHAPSLPPTAYTF